MAHVVGQRRLAGHWPLNPCARQRYRMARLRQSTVSKPTSTLAPCWYVGAGPYLLFSTRRWTVQLLVAVGKPRQPRQASDRVDIPSLEETLSLGFQPPSSPGGMVSAPRPPDRASCHVSSHMYWTISIVSCSTLLDAPLSFFIPVA